MDQKPAGAGGAGLLEFPQKGLLNECGRRAGSGRTRIGRCRGVARVLSHSLTELCHLTSELGELMLGVWIGCAGRNPAVDEIRYLLSGLLVLSSSLPSCLALL